MLTRSLLLLLLCTVALRANADDLRARRADFRQALEIAERRPLSEFSTATRALTDHPLFPYLEYAHLRRQLDSIAAPRVRQFLDRNADIPVSANLLESWLRALIKRRDWLNYRAFYVQQTDSELRCAALQARLATGMDASFLDDAQAMWLSGTSVPALCDPAFAALKVAGRLTPSLYWQRIELAAASGNDSLMRYLARNLPAAQQALGESYAQFIAAPVSGNTGTWPDDERSRAIALHGLSRLAQSAPDAAEARFDTLRTMLKFDPAQQARLRAELALWSAASYLPDSAARFARVPDAGFDERLHGWRVREALARSDFASAQRALSAMPETQRADPRWRYLDARLRERAGDSAAARLEFASLAREPNYYGFLAADRLTLPYALCPIEASDDAGLRASVRASAGLERALELRAIERDGWARREWNAALAGMSVDERRVAVALADEAQWHDRAVFTLTSGDDMRAYTLRFPLPFTRQLLLEARKHDLDPAWVAALIRAESAWIPDARSHANARGLMQLLPGTARDEARRLGLRWQGEAALNLPQYNLALGTAHLARMQKEHDGKPYLATAAYNAGAKPVARWTAQRGSLDPDLFIETIPYHETREYVARILAFSVIYDWRLSGTAVPVSRRMRGETVATAARRSFHCPSNDARTTAR